MRNFQRDQVLWFRFAESRFDSFVSTRSSDRPAAAPLRRVRRTTCPAWCPAGFAFVSIGRIGPVYRARWDGASQKRPLGVGPGPLNYFRSSASTRTMLEALAEVSGAPGGVQNRHRGRFTLAAHDDAVLSNGTAFSELPNSLPRKPGSFLSSLVRRSARNTCPGCDPGLRP